MKNVRIENPEFSAEYFIRMTSIVCRKCGAKIGSPCITVNSRTRPNGLQVSQVHADRYKRLGIYPAGMTKGMMKRNGLINGQKNK